MVPGMMPQGMMPQQGGGMGMGMGRTSTMGSTLGFGGGFPQGPRSVAGTQRPMTMLDPRGAAYAASIAPSERSNVGMPDRYRPVSQMPVENGNGTAGPRMSVLGMGGGMGGGAKGPTVRPVGVEEEDEEDAWEEMKRQKEKKKSLWRMKREKKEVGEVAMFTS
ncbi:hypothetical protein V494_07976 [Pseudogymnoascus sp. VKM F-4513 (FW-928)]|nr:hypothetical protein V494_07976 [Pseudogymnoascus sp. VKM F-4513 (FW-928)]